ncbi:Gfo/Idh/MocA family protein [Leptospira alstonii]|uniref:Oxidoreductase family, C-terminal alpha/beta domain protein n=1 Tax=Leptospira alstonii serovar Sichuan str. 79601 TaxID=1218565 RepID=M6D1C3_9LEPT|nr:Gfo/Idh/MocA family oxidoreductase [Leptospira alstonii]EMJ97779.1 oxidoreductase family, C-terminal alpha/beta domain protein [Leptospira alstonii serovar Sichuan str. 79601]
MIPVLLIGLGRIGSLLEKDPLRNRPCTHAGTIFSSWGRKKFFLLGAIDPSEERRNRFCKDWNIPKEACFSDFKNWSASFRFRQNRKDTTKSRDLKSEVRSDSTVLGKNGVPTSNNSKQKTSVRKVGTSSKTKAPLSSFSINDSDIQGGNFTNSQTKRNDRNHTDSNKIQRGRNSELKQKSRNSARSDGNGEGSQIESETLNSSHTQIDVASCLVVIATPSETHYELAKAAIDFGFRHLLVEKPVCHSLPLARKLAKLCRETGTDLRVNHERRYHPLYIQVRKWIREGTYGPVRTIRASVLTSARNPGRAILDKTGPLFHDGTHAVDLLTWYLGMPDRVYSVLRSYPDSSVEEQALALMTYPQGETVFLEAGGMRNYFQFELDIQTENARFLVGNDEVRFWKSKPSRKYKGFKSLTPASISEKSSAGSNPFLNLYDSLFRHISGKPSDITGDMEENLQILTLLDTIRRRAEKRILEV